MYYNHEFDNCAYCEVSDLTAEQAVKFQSFLLKFLAPDFLTIEKFGYTGPVDVYGNVEHEQDTYKVECVFKIEVDDEGSMPLWVVGGLAKYSREKLQFTASQKIRLFLLNNEDLKKLLPPSDDSGSFGKNVRMRKILESATSDWDLTDCFIHVGYFKDYGFEVVEEEHEIYTVEKIENKTIE